MDDNMTGKTCIVTGASSGIGITTAEGLAAQGATVVMACRDLEKSKKVQEQIIQKTGSDKVDLLHLDLASQASIREFAKNFQEKYTRLDVLINNAAIIPLSRQTTEDGYESQFGVNHLGPFLLTHLLLDRIKESTPSRIVNVTSIMHHQGDINFDNLQSEQKYGTLDAYRQSKLANVLFTYELARKLEGTGVTVNCLHPGVVNTSISRSVPFFLQPLVKLAGKFFMLSPEQGAATSLHVATSPDLNDVTGKFFNESKEARSSRKSQDEELASRLWEVSQSLTGLA